MLCLGTFKPHRSAVQGLQGVARNPNPLDCLGPLSKVVPNGDRSMFYYLTPLQLLNKILRSGLSKLDSGKFDVLGLAWTIK